MSYVTARRRDTNSDANRLYLEDKSAHDWYRFVLSFPPHLVRQYLERFRVTSASIVLDPFCGTGTTVVECKKMGISALGIEGNPMAHFAGTVKTDWSGNNRTLKEQAKSIAEKVYAVFADQNIEDEAFQRVIPEGLSLQSLPDELMALLLKDSISPLPLHKALILRNMIHVHAFGQERDYLLLALGKTLVNNISNLHFGPEVGLGIIKTDASVVAPWLANVNAMAEDIASLQEKRMTPSNIYLGDARRVKDIIAPNSIDAVITSPPYPNEKDYTRTTRLESVMLGFVQSKSDLRKMKKGLVRSNTRGVYKEDDDDSWITHLPQIQHLADTIEHRRLELNKTSGFERMYARVTRLYFGGMARHLSELRTCLRPGAQLAYVVGDQASYFRIMIRTGTILAEIGKELGYNVVAIDLFRTRIATATKEQMREEVVVLQWPG